MARTDPPRGETAPTHMRLGRDTLADLDLIAEALSVETGAPATRTSVVRLLARREAAKLRRKNSEKISE